MSKRTTEEVAEGLALATLPYPGRADARIESVDCARPENIKVGMALKVKYLLREERGKRRPIWHSSLSKRGEYYATQG